MHWGLIASRQVFSKSIDSYLAIISELVLYYRTPKSFNEIQFTIMELWIKNDLRGLYLFLERLRYIHKHVPTSHIQLAHLLTKSWLMGQANVRVLRFKMSPTIVIGSLEKCSPVISWFYTYTWKILKFQNFNILEVKFQFRKFQAKKWKLPIPIPQT